MEVAQESRGRSSRLAGRRAGVPRRITVSASTMLAKDESASRAVLIQFQPERDEE